MLINLITWYTEHVAIKGMQTYMDLTLSTWISGVRNVSHLIIYIEENDIVKL